MIKSEKIDLLSVAHIAAQRQIKNAVKDSHNQHYNSTYADIASVWDVCREPLTENGLSVIQTVGKHESDWVLETTLLHKSGQFITGIYPLLPDKSGPQAFKSAVTYAKRTSLEAIAGVAGVDDDANAATNFSQKPESKPVVYKPKTPIENKAPQQPNHSNEYRIGFGKYKGMALSEVNPDDLKSYADYLMQTSLRDGKELKGNTKEFIERVGELFNENGTAKPPTDWANEEIPF